MSTHAVLSPSSASRWMACPRSARFEEQIPEDTSEFAEEGTLAHEIAALLIMGRKVLKEQKKNKYYTKEMVEFVNVYANTVDNLYRQHREFTSNVDLLVEQRVDLGFIIPDGFGTADAVVMSEGLLDVVDLKYGKGQPVSAYQNKQMLCYAIGLFMRHHQKYNFKQIRLTIVQPRLYDASTWTLNVNELMEWRRTIKAAADMAYGDQGEFKPGAHCRFCRGRGQCRALNEICSRSLDMYPHEVISVNAMSTEELAEAYAILPAMEIWCKAVKEAALSRAIESGLPGYKVVEGVSRRKIIDEDGFTTALKAAGFDDEQIFDKKVKSFGELEKIVKQKYGADWFDVALGKYIERPVGSPVLAPFDDKRKAINPIETAALDFAGLEYR